MIRPARMEGKNSENVARGTKKEKNCDLSFKIYKKYPFNIHLKGKKPDIPLGEGRKGKKWGQIDISNVMAKYKISFQSIRQYARYIWEVTLSERMKTNIVWTALSSKMKG
jgi:hypothetical protein